MREGLLQNVEHWLKFNIARRSHVFNQDITDDNVQGLLDVYRDLESTFAEYCNGVEVIASEFYPNNFLYDDLAEPICIKPCNLTLLSQNMYLLDNIPFNKGLFNIGINSVEAQFSRVTSQGKDILSLQRNRVLKYVRLRYQIPGYRSDIRVNRQDDGCRLDFTHPVVFSQAGCKLEETLYIMNNVLGMHGELQSSPFSH